MSLHCWLKDYKRKSCYGYYSIVSIFSNSVWDVHLSSRNLAHARVEFSVLHLLNAHRRSIQHCSHQSVCQCTVHRCFYREKARGKWWVIKAFCWVRMSLTLLSSLDRMYRCLCFTLRWCKWKCLSLYIWQLESEAIQTDTDSKFPYTLTPSKKKPNKPKETFF